MAQSLPLRAAALAALHRVTQKSNGLYGANTCICTLATQAWLSHSFTCPSAWKYLLLFLTAGFLRVYLATVIELNENQGLLLPLHAMTKAAHAPVASHGVTFLTVAAFEVSKYAFLSTL